MAPTNFLEPLNSLLMNTMSSLGHGQEFNHTSHLDIRDDIGGTYNNIREDPSFPLQNPGHPPRLSDINPTDVMPQFYFEDSEVFLPSSDAKNDKDLLVRFYHNMSKVISDTPGYAGSPYTSLTAPELDLVTVVRGHNMTRTDDILYLYSNHTDDLAWLIPAIFIGTLMFFIIVYVSFYGVKTLEMKVRMFYLSMRGCCCQSQGEPSGDETDALNSNMVQQHIEMNAYYTNSVDNNFIY